MARSHIRITITVCVLAVMTLAGCGSSDSHQGFDFSAGPDTTPAPSAEAPKPTGTTGETPPSAPVAATPAPAVTRPHIVWNPIPFGAKRKAEMAAYANRHYGIDSYRLRDPHVIVIHYTETPSFQATYKIFAPDTPDPELHETPNVCAHFVIGADGVIHQLVPLTIMCRHTVGLNWTSIGVEHVGNSDAQVLGDRKQMRSSIALVHWLRCRFGISVKNVIGHNEGLASPYHRENIARWRTQTHADFNRTDMNRYRARLRRAGGCPRATG